MILRLFMQLISCALSRALASAGSSKDARIAMIAIWLRSDFGFYLLILAYFSEMFSCFLENPIEDFWIYRLKYRGEDVVRFDESLWIGRDSFRYDTVKKNLLCHLAVRYTFAASCKANDRRYFAATVLHPCQSDRFSAASVLEACLKIIFQFPVRIRPESPWHVSHWALTKKIS